MHSQTSDCRVGQLHHHEPCDFALVSRYFVTRTDSPFFSFQHMLTTRPPSLSNKALDRMLSDTCVLHPVKVPTIGSSPAKLIPCRRCGVPMRLPGSACRGFCCGTAYDACQKRQQVKIRPRTSCEQLVAGVFAKLYLIGRYALCSDCCTRCLMPRSCQSSLLRPDCGR